MRKNCWEVNKCNREPGGKNVTDCGICPAAITQKFDGINNGKNGGRFCWAIAGTLCKNSVQGSYANKLLDCINCEFLKSVQEEEDRKFVLTPNNV